MQGVTAARVRYLRERRGHLLPHPGDEICETHHLAHNLRASSVTLLPPSRFSFVSSGIRSHTSSATAAPFVLVKPVSRDDAESESRLGGSAGGRRAACL